ncbi:hypothetical protein BO83DRAFT_410792 [Aspergillus eucalypticola CBS 122712]|uniref:Uncharacterized protein n=1 Tax=Aspergillus eucalypticola (strain CBS 122712 / IBT 29274) TaxID=1448314 RepID=A0A317UW41_ASPEC|nr:uncharacterized protein BO83DRAFT_410792 [Aspergillus eucalypticola CBS 122712]PWY65875.1 hypothetical protein BO83DRAFT_410792 [Aspergillus eucalypticola CBS 122712]
MPSPAQLALAMAIVKLKPPDVDFKGNIPILIRHHIKSTHSSDRSYTHDKFFDSVSFWQQAYERSEAEQCNLLDRIYELEQHNESLRARLQGADDAGAENGQSALKRKTTAKGAAPGSGVMTRKRAKTQTFSRMDTSVFGNSLSTGLDGGVVDHLDFCEPFTAPFMRQLYALQKVLQKRPNNSNVVSAAMELCAAATKTVLDAIEQPIVSRSTTKAIPEPKRPDILAVLNSTENAFLILIQTFKKLSASGQHMRDAGQITYSIVRLYEVIIEALGRHCRRKAEQQLRESKPSAKQTQPRQKAKTKRFRTGYSVDDQNQADEGDEIATHMSLLLSRMALSLNIDCVAKQSILEGFLFVLLSRVGKLVSLFVFHDLRLRPDLQMNDAKFPLPGGLEGINMAENTLPAAAMEAKSLIWPLEKMLVLLEDAPSMSSDPSHGCTNEQLAAKLKGKLQATLLHSVFGTDSLWPEALQYPMGPDERDLERLQTCSGIPEQSVPDWFVQEIWRLIGWEMLAARNSPKM